MSAVQLCVATPGSFAWGASPVERLAARAAERGIRALGLADENGLWEAVPFQEACEARGVQPILGARLRVEGVRAQALVRNRAGFAALCRLVTRIQHGGFPAAAAGMGSSRRLLGELRDAGDGLAILSREETLLAGLRAARGPGDLFVPLRPSPAGESDLALAERLRFPPVAAPEVVFSDPGEWARHRLLAAIGRRARIAELQPRDLAQRTAWLHGAAGLARDYAFAPHALSNAARLAERCRYRIPLGGKLLPRFSAPAGRSARAHLQRLCARGWRRRRLGEEPRYRTRLKKELALIGRQGMAGYFLIVADIVRFARSRGILHCGRGSAANSLVAWLLGFTHVDPVRHDLYFERFMNAGRSDFPDVDLDFAWDERDAVLDYVRQRFGRERVAMIGTHVTFGLRGAVRELAKAMGVPPSEIEPFSRALPGRLDGALDEERLRADPRCARLPIRAEPWRTILAQANALQGFPRHLGIHPGGVVIAPSPLTDHLPLQLARKRTGAGRMVITQWDMEPVEKAGLLKIDLLGNRGLAVIRDAAAAVERNLGLRIDFDHLDPQKDQRTCSLLERGETMGCFYVESPGMRGLLQKLQCRDFATLVAASSIIRPGISSSGMMQAYVERHHFVRRHGRHDPSWYPLPCLRSILGETCGVMAYQEDVLKVVQEVAGMTAAEADGLRRSMSHKRSREKVASFRESFLEGARRRGVGAAVAQELWRQIESFAGYSFCKAHSASYARVSFLSAYLRAHHPAEFLAAVLANGGGFYTTFAYLAEARRMGLCLELPCVNRSGDDFQGAEGGVRLGLAQVNGLGAAVRARILEARRRCGPFQSLEDFGQRVRPAPSEWEALIRAGALDGLPDGMTRPERMRAAALWGRTFGGPEPGARLFPDAAVRRPPPPAAEYSPRRRLAQEAEALGFLVSTHPLALFGEAIRRTHAVPARELKHHVNRRVRLVGWQVTNKPVTTRTGRPMMFVSFEDTTAIYETILFPRVYRRLAAGLLTRGPYLLEGTVREEYGALTVEVDALRLLEGR